MKIIKDSIVKGKKRLVVELEEGEQIAAFDPHKHYQLGYPVEDIVEGHIINNASPVVWCSIEQKWI